MENVSLPEAARDGLSALRATRPLVHHITNGVVMNFTANVTLCLGAQPVMAPAIEESAEMVGFAGALLLNIGTLDPALVGSMVRAGERAAELGIPVILDPVGAGATKLRTEAALRLMKEVRPSVVRGNAGELLALAGEAGRVRGVDSTASAEGNREVLVSLAAGWSTVVAATGPVDFLTDGSRSIEVRNGHPIMSRVTGTGCGATTAVACFATLGGDLLARAAGALSVYGAAAELAAERAGGPGTFVPLLLDALAAMTPERAGAMAR